MNKEVSDLVSEILMEGGNVYKRARLKAIAEAEELLWDNIENSIWWDRFSSFSEDEKPNEKMRIQHSYYHPTLVSLVTSFTQSILGVNEPSARLVLQYGASTRLQSIYRATKKFAKISYPDRVKVCSKDEHEQLGDTLLIIYVCLPAFFDAMAMASYRVFKPKNFNEIDADLFSRKYWQAIGLEHGYSEISKYIPWFKRIQNDMRHPYVHRIPPYVPSAEHTEKDAEVNLSLSESRSAAFAAGDYDKASDIFDEQERLGSFSPKIYFFEKDAWTPLNSTVFNDIFTFQIVALKMLEVLLPNQGFVGSNVEAQNL